MDSVTIHTEVDVRIEDVIVEIDDIDLAFELGRRGFTVYEEDLAINDENFIPETTDRFFAIFNQYISGDRNVATDVLKDLANHVLARLRSENYLSVSDVGDDEQFVMNCG